MNYASPSSWTPEKTPPTIKHLIILISTIAISCATLQAIFAQFDLFPGPNELLALSWWGISQGYLWQPLSFLFIQESLEGLSFSFFLALLFNMYLLWTLGSAVYRILGQGPFLRLYFIGGIAAGLLSLLSMKLTGQYAMLTGVLPPLLILFTVYGMAFPETEILLFFLLPVKIKWMIVSFLGILILTTLSHLDFPQLTLYLSSIVIAYTYSVAIHGWYSPFSATLRFDMRLSRIASSFRSFLPFKKKESQNPQVKIVDISSKKPMETDDAFVDAMLTKISQKGEDSLTWGEKRRLQEISNKQKTHSSNKNNTY